MNISKDNLGNLVMSADVNEQKEIEELLSNDLEQTMVLKESIFICNYLLGFEQVNDFGQLTSAPLISDGKYIYGFMNYATEDFLVKLVRGEEIVWKKIR